MFEVSFGGLFAEQKMIKKHIIPKPHTISKNATMGAQRLEMYNVLEPFGHPFFIKIRDHPNLLDCNTSHAKLVFC